MIVALKNSETDFVTFVATLLGGIAALMVVGASARTLYRRTLGRRHDRYERLARLGTGAHLSFFVSVLGEPPAIRHTITKNSVRIVGPGEPGFDPTVPVDSPDNPTQEVWEPEGFTECFFVDRDYYVQTISDDDETVLAFSVTIRRERFRPTLWIPRKRTAVERFRHALSYRRWPRPVAKVKLGRTRFADLDSKDPDNWAPPHFRASMGARSAFYSEFHYFGNPGHYQHYVFTSGTNTPGGGEFHRIGQAAQQAGFQEWPYPARRDPDDLWQPPPPENQPEWEAIPDAAAFRRSAVITTYTVILRLWPENYPSTFGPHGDEVRTLP
jgi:hypothetical protein